MNGLIIHKLRCWMCFACFLVAWVSTARVAQMAVPRLEPAPCLVDADATMECYWLVVHQHRRAAAGRDLHLPVVVLRSPNATTAAPLVCSLALDRGLWALPF